MANSNAAHPLDAEFYQPAERFFPGQTGTALTYDDVTLATLYSEILPRDTQLDTQLADSLLLNIPVISSDMDTVDRKSTRLNSVTATSRMPSSA